MNIVYIAGVIVVFDWMLVNEALHIPDHIQAHAKKLHNLCQKEIGVPEALIKQTATGTLSNDRLMQCYFHCMFDKVGLIDQSNVIHLEYIMDVLPPETHAFVRKLVDMCGTKGGADACETAYLTVKCYYEADPEALANKFNFLVD